MTDDCDTCAGDSTENWTFLMRFKRAEEYDRWPSPRVSDALSTSLRDMAALGERWARALCERL